MINKILLVISAIFLLSGCSLDSLLKRSANNKLIDMKGFHGGKRRPLYNKKYIDRAKVNIAQNDYEDEEDYDDEYADEKMPPSMRNRFMYQDMIEDDRDARRQKKSKKRGAYRSHMVVPDRYQDVAHAREIAKENRGESDDELRRELSEIKSMLSSAKKDLTKYRCPVETAKEQPVKKAPSVNKKLHEQVYSEHEASARNTTHKKAGPAHLEDTNEHIAMPPKPQAQPQVQLQPQPQQNIAPEPQKVFADEPIDNTPQPVSVPQQAPVPVAAPEPAPVQSQPVQVPVHATLPQAQVQHQVPVEAPQVQRNPAEAPTPVRPQEQHVNEPAIPALPKLPVSNSAPRSQ